MKLSQLVLKSMAKNMRHYYLYFFSLTFSVTLFFSFMTLQYNPSVLKATEISGTATSGFNAASYMLYFIVLIFVLYANHLFMKRRSKEIGLYQLIGMTKGLVTRLLAWENILLFTGAVAVGMLMGLLTSRLFAMILLKLLKFDAVVSMSFSKEAIFSTCILFGILLVVILVQMAFMVNRTTLLSLFTADKQTDERVKRIGAWPMLMGAIGLAFIGFGYYRSTLLFSAQSAGNLFVNMIIILAATIGGTYFVFRYSVMLLLNLWRLRKKGHLNLVDVLAVTPIMHRMKSNAKSLTLITVLTAVSLAITTLSYISYYSSSESAERQVVADYVAVDGREVPFLQALEAAGIGYETEVTHMTTGQVNLSDVLPIDLLEQFSASNMLAEQSMIPLSDYQRFYPDLQLEDDEMVITAYNGFMAKFTPIEPGFSVDVKHGDQAVSLTATDVHEDAVLNFRLTGSGMIFVVTDAVYEQFVAYNATAPLEQVAQTQIAIFLKDEQDLEQAEALYIETGAYRVEDTADSVKFSSLYEAKQYNLKTFGVTIFTTAFLGLAFLLSTGSILYIKQVAEAEAELGSYTILRKIGFSEQELMRGLMYKQLFNFGVPLAIGLLHSYFAVKSGWFLFGSELYTPLFITMGVYITLYSVFAMLSIRHYRQIVKQAL